MKKKEFDFNKMNEAQLMHFEIAKELGLDKKIISNGWGSLSAKESGKIGGIISSRNKKKKKNSSNKVPGK